jgi:hypothetical protein
VEDENITKMIKEKEDGKKVKEQLLKNKETLIAQMNNELEKIQESSLKFACFLKLSAITPYNDAMVDYMNKLIREEEDVVNADSGQSDVQLRALEMELESYKANVAILMKKIEEGDKISAANELPDIEQLIKDLYNLKHSGEYIRKAFETNTGFQRDVTTTTTKYVESKQSWLKRTRDFVQRNNPFKAAVVQEDSAEVMEPLRTAEEAEPVVISTAPAAVPGKVKEYKRGKKKK